MATRTIRGPVSIGDRFGRWQVARPADPKIYGRHQHARWGCRCDCGTERAVTQMSLQNGKSLSCGCFQREAAAALHTTHGQAADGRPTPEYDAWQSMHARCRNSNNPRYADYGGRGISVCERWSAFEAFFADMGHRPSVIHQIDRENNDAGYAPENCRWALPPEQMVNRRNTRFVDVDGEQVPLATLAKQSGIPANTLRARVLAGWSLQRALTQALGPTGPKRKR